MGVIELRGKKKKERSWVSTLPDSPYLMQSAGVSLNGALNNLTISKEQFSHTST
jgi:hypothetical protein